MVLALLGGVVREQGGVGAEVVLEWEERDLELDPVEIASVLVVALGSLIRQGLPATI